MRRERLLSSSAPLSNSLGGHTRRQRAGGGRRSVLRVEELPVLVPVRGKHTLSSPTRITRKRANPFDSNEGQPARQRGEGSSLLR